MISHQPVLDEVCRAYALRCETPAQQVSARVWRLASDRGPVAIKLYAPEHRARARKEAMLVSHLQTAADRRFRVQAIMRAIDGSVLWEARDFCAMASRWENGQFRPYDTFTPTQWAALGTSLAALHRQLDGLRVPVMDTLRDRLNAIDVGALRLDLARDRIRAAGRPEAGLLESYIDVCLCVLDEFYPGSIAGFPADDPQWPIHNDYNQFNYLFGAALPPLILDWEASIGAPREYELVRCLNHLPLEAPELATVFVHAYLRVRPLRPECIQWAVDAACLQQGLKRWIIQGWLDDPQRHAGHLSGSYRMASMMLDARAQLARFFHNCIQA